MVSIDLYVAFIAASLVLIAIPGPNVALIVANSLTYGVTCGLLTVAGTSSAMILQLAVTGIGMHAALGELAGFFANVRWIGVAYLLYLGIAAWGAPDVDLAAIKAQKRTRTETYIRAFLVSLTNPKTLLFYGAFLPQFIDHTADPDLQLTILSLTFLVLATIGDSLWALLAARLRPVLTTRGRLRHRLTGVLLVSCAGLLALAKIDG